MNRIMMSLPIVGLVLLISFCVMDPLMLPPFLVVTVPLIIFTTYSEILRRKIKKELKDTIRVFQAEKEEIVKEIKRKEARQQEQNEQLRDFSRDLSGALTKDQLLRIIVQRFSKITASAAGESQCFLLSHDPGSDELHYEMGDNFDSNTLTSLRFNANDEIINAVLTSKKICTYISDIFGGDSNVRYFLKDERITYLSQLGSLALIPLVLEDEVWGIVVIFCHEEAAVRIKNEEKFYILLIAQASIALGSAIHRGLASIDRLTQLYNRTFLQRRIKEETEFCNRQMLPLSLMMIDIDHFKEINDTYGHKEGDMVLKKIAQIISKNVRLTDVCARFGGEEFVVVLPGICEDRTEKFSIAERLRKAVEAADFIILQEKQIKLTISIGVAVRRFPGDKNLSVDELIEKADKLLYQAKREGRNRVCYDRQ